MRKIIAVLIILLLSSTPASGDDSDYLCYNEFIEMVENGRIVSVEVDQFSSIHGIYVKDREKIEFQTYSDTGSSNDPLLIRLLKKHDVSVAIKDKIESEISFPIFYSVISILLPIVTFIFIIFVNIKLNKIIKNTKKTNL